MNAAARMVLTPPSWLYRGVVALRNAYYDVPWAVRSAPVPVISVGNLTLGGTGKTPVVAWVARQLQRMGSRPAVVSRGYGGTAGRGPVFVSRGDGPQCGADLAGDEPVELAASLHGVRVVVGSDRQAGAEAASADGADVVILDDGFQHRRLARDLDVVLLDAASPFDEGRLIPSGRLREPPRALARANFVLITRARDLSDHSHTESAVHTLAPGATVLLADHEPLGFFDARGREADTPERAVVFCGVGNPLRFREDVERQGIRVAEFRPFRDHHVYSPEELEGLRQTARAADASLVTTAKDLARIAAKARQEAEPPMLALRIAAVIRSPEPLIGALRRLSSSRGP